MSAIIVKALESNSNTPMLLWLVDYKDLPMGVMLNWSSPKHSLLQPKIWNLTSEAVQFLNSNRDRLLPPDDEYNECEHIKVLPLMSDTVEEYNDVLNRVQ